MSPQIPPCFPRSSEFTSLTRTEPFFYEESEAVLFYSCYVVQGCVIIGKQLQRNLLKITQPYIILVKLSFLLLL